MFSRLKRIENKIDLILERTIEKVAYAMFEEHFLEQEPAEEEKKIFRQKLKDKIIVFDGGKND